MKVHYLCHPPSDNLNFIYAAELPADYYTPGMFCIEAYNAAGGIAEEFQFPAMLNGIMIIPKLTKVGSRTYSVEIKELSLKFFFKLIRFDKYSRYIGQLSARFEDYPLFRVQPASSSRLEKACLKHDFYFVGFGYEMPELNHKEYD